MKPDDLAAVVEAALVASNKREYGDNLTWPNGHSEDEQKEIRAGATHFLLAALRAAEARGLKLMPKEPNKSMLVAGLQAALDYYGIFGFKRLWPWSRGEHPSQCLAACHRAMHDAAPGVGEK